MSRRIERNEKCGCYHCLEVYNSKEIQEWTDGQTALCPKCGVDSVLAGFIDKTVLKEFHDQLF